MRVTITQKASFIIYFEGTSLVQFSSVLDILRACCYNLNVNNAIFFLIEPVIAFVTPTENTFAHCNLSTPVKPKTYFILEVEFVLLIWSLRPWVSRLQYIKYSIHFLSPQYKSPLSSKTLLCCIHFPHISVLVSKERLNVW